MAKAGAKKRKGPKSGSRAAARTDLRGASRIVQARLHAGYRAATINRTSVLRSAFTLLAATAVLAIFALWLGGSLGTVRDSFDTKRRDSLMAMGFTVDRIDVTGEGRLIEDDVRAAMGIHEGDYFFGADLVRAQNRIESLPWVDHALVRRLWPNRVVVHLVEQTPYALYQEGGIIHLTDSEGSIIAPLTSETARLPDGLRLFTGRGAARDAPVISAQLKAFPDVWSRTKSLTRHASGRWDLRLDDGTVVRLPVENVPLALGMLSTWWERLGNGYGVVDLRLPDRLTLTRASASDA